MMLTSSLALALAAELLLVVVASACYCLLHSATQREHCRVCCYSTICCCSRSRSAYIVTLSRVCLQLSCVTTEVVPQRYYCNVLVQYTSTDSDNGGSYYSKEGCVMSSYRCAVQCTD
jgi:hypothetical protein